MPQAEQQWRWQPTVLCSWIQGLCPSAQCRTGKCIYAAHCVAKFRGNMSLFGMGVDERAINNKGYGCVPADRAMVYCQ
jgi:hypothetical protein